MRRSRSLLSSQRVALFSAILMFACSSTSAFCGQSSTPLKYATAQVLPVAVQPGVSISDNYVSGMQVRIVHALEASKRFAHVTQSSEAPASENSTVKIASTVTKFVPGNRAERYLIGYGAGATKITVHVVFSDAETNKTLVEQDVRGLIWFGTPAKGFGNPNSAQKDISKSIKKIAEKYF